MPDDWKEILVATGLPVAISPLHDKDVNPDGEIKKAHYHVIACYSGPVSESVVCRITEKLNAPRPIPIENVRGNYRYFTHMDNPEKYQYDVKDILVMNGFSILDYADFTKSEVLATKRKLTQLIIDMGIVEYSDFMEYVLYNGSELDFDVASSNTLYFNNYLKSARYRIQGSISSPTFHHRRSPTLLGITGRT